MPVNSSEDIIKRAREMEMIRRFGGKSTENSGMDSKELRKKLEILEMKMDRINQKLDSLLSEKKSLEFKDVHKRILNILNEWMSTENLAKALGYSQEYVSRKISELKEMGKIEEKRSGKNLYYRRK